MEMLEEYHPKVVPALKSSKSTNLDLRNVLLLDNQSTFDLCCNKTFASKIIKEENTLSMTSNGGGLKITEKCKIPGYKYLVLLDASGRPNTRRDYEKALRAIKLLNVNIMREPLNISGTRALFALAA
jgi:hypothetical protein